MYFKYQFIFYLDNLLITTYLVRIFSYVKFIFKFFFFLFLIFKLLPEFIKVFLAGVV